MNSLDWTVARMPGSWIGDEWTYSITTLNDRCYREHDGFVQVLTERGWSGVPTLTNENVKLTPDEAVIAYDAVAR
jgi:hypothetical protein